MTAVRPEGSAGATGQPGYTASAGPAHPPGAGRAYPGQAYPPDQPEYPAAQAYPAPPTGGGPPGGPSGDQRSWYPPPQAPRDPYGAPPQGAPGPYGPQGPLQGAPDPYAPAHPPQPSAPGYGPAQGHGAGAEPPPPAPRRRDRLETTAELPSLDLDDPAEAEPDEDGRDEGGEDSAPLTGGRAERRKAAKRGGRRRPPAAPATGSELALTSGAPVSRVEARRAAKAAKPGVGVLVSQGVGELFITLGVLMLLFVVYQLWYTNVLADEQTSGATNNLQHSWASDTETSSDAGEPSSFPQGTDFAIIYIPKLDVKAPIAEGVDKTTILDKGDVGHYDGAQETAMPWASSGNFALAGHRNTHGEPFRYINKLVPGDKVYVETKGMYYTYEITHTLPQTSASNVSVIEPVPPQSGFTAPGRYITLTTCTPEFTSEFRLIVWGKLVAEQPRTKGTPAALLGG